MTCVNYFGEYSNMIVLSMPDHMKGNNGGFYTTKDTISIDPCIVDEIKFLWEQGVHTYHSCCGHGKIMAEVIVDNRSSDIMEKLGYSLEKSWHEEFQQKGEDVDSMKWYLKSEHKQSEGEK